MRMRIRAALEEMFNPEKPFQERIFSMMTIFAFIVVTLVTIGDILSGENWVECGVLFSIVIMNPIITTLMIRKKKIKLGGGLVAFSIVFVVLPVTFFFGGGLRGGSLIWFSFSYLFIGLILTGRLRIIMLSLLTLLVFVEFFVAYFFPGVIVGHSRKMWFIDTAISVLLVGYVVCVSVWFVNGLFAEESRRAKEQAKEIEALNQSQNRFFSSMSHEIRTPINTIIGLNEMILREDVSEEVAENARNIKNASQILLSVINDILDMSKMESGKMEIVHAAYDAGEMLSEIVNMVWIRAREKGLEFVVDVDPGMPRELYSDEVRIKQILINLLNNAIKYTEEGRVSLTIHARKTGSGRVLVTYSVEDTGMGIRRESLPHLFDAFRREDEHKNRYIEGTGLGLSIVKQLVDLLGGEIAVNSVYTQGSVFEVSIEQELVSEAVMGKFDPAQSHAGGRRPMYHQSFEAPRARILVVDDNTTNLLVVTKLLRETKVQIETVTGGEKALELTLVNHFDVILMDHMMPGMDGIECLHAIREQAGGLNRESPIVALTANAGSDSIALYRQEGFDGYLLKPVDANLLEDTLLGLLPTELVSVSEGDGERYDSEQIVRQMKRKVPLVITTDSVSDLPTEIIEHLKIPVLPYKVHMQSGVFTDGLEAEGDVIIRYMGDDDITARSEAPDVAEYEEFFSSQLMQAQHVVHIVMSKYASKGFENAAEAALSFYNVEVFDSGHLSSGMGLIVLFARELLDSGLSDTGALMDKLELMKSRVHTSFIVGNTAFLYRGGRLAEWVHRLCQSLMLHPVIELKNGNMSVGQIISGGTEKVRSVYIHKCFSYRKNIDTSMLFITYAGMKRSEVEQIRDEVLALVPFETVYLQKASPAISINCGPGTFGLLFKRK